MEALRRVCTHLLILAAATTLFACNLATTDEPLNGQRYPSAPVDIQVLLEPGADTATFRAFLNGSEITDRFALNPDLKVMKATVDTADGLLIGVNELATLVHGEAQGVSLRDTDGRLFHVDEGGVATNRDDRGVWFITGPEDASIYEIAEAMGYAVATDRLWQIEQISTDGPREVVGNPRLEHGSHGHLSAHDGLFGRGVDRFLRCPRPRNQRPWSRATWTASTGESPTFGPIRRISPSSSSSST